MNKSTQKNNKYNPLAVNKVAEKYGFTPRYVRACLKGDYKGIMPDLKTAFAFGFSDGGILFFHPENHSVWVIYDDLYTELVTDTFDEFLEKATFQRQWDFK